MKLRRISVFALLSLLLAACANNAGTKPLAADTGSGETVVAAAGPTIQPASPAVSGDDMTRMDDQGSVTVEITPLNLSRASESLEFKVALNTHSVDLNFDMAALSSLTTDTGQRALAVSWDGPRGGHHIMGKLVFVATQDGRSILEGAKRITLTIRDVFAPSRIFEWQLN